MNITDILNLEQAAINRERKEEHLHLDGIEGASSSGGCNLFGAYKAEHIPMPKLTGLKAEFGAMDIGTIIHEWAQGKIIRHNQNMPLSQEFGIEVMVKIQITDQTAIESPIDIALATHSNPNRSPFIMQPWQFRNETRDVMVLNEGATWDYIWDIKSCSDFSYFKVLNNGNPIIPWKWKTQFHVYMKATGLKEIAVLMIHKEKGWHKELVIPWEDSVWERLVESIKRKEEIRAALRDGTTQIALTKKDLEYFNNDGIEDDHPICWYSCNLSETYEDIDDKGKPRLKLRKPCEAAVYFLKKDAQNKFAVGQMWQYGNSHITIDKIDWKAEMIYAHNKKGDVKECGIYAALDQFSVIKPKGDK
jgi:hypothetical protein